MPHEFHQRVRQLFDRALERPREDRTAFLQSACSGDPILLQAVEQLIRTHEVSASSSAEGARPATRIGRYVIRGELGRGAMGIVYDAVDPVIGRSVAVKMIHLNGVTAPGEAEFLRDRLFREASSAGQLFHRGIVIIFDVGQEQDSAFIAMERVDGPSIQQILASRRISASEALEILRQTASALDYAHQHGVVHRDIKPANIMLHNDRTVKVADFGIAKVVSAQRSTMSGVAIGTPSYMSPEQIEARPVDGRSDQFSLAVLAYEMLTGKRPFEGESIATLAHQIVFGPRPSAHAANPSLPQEADKIFERALSRSAEERYETCLDFVAVLQRIFDADRANARTLPQTRRLSERVKKRSGRLSASLATLGIVALAAGIGFLFWRWEHARAIAATPIPQPKVATLAPAIRGFHAEPSSIEAGQPVLLRWETSGASETVIDNGVGKIPATGTFTVRPTTSTVYVLSASAAGDSVRATVSVDVKPKTVTPASRAQGIYNDAKAKRREGHPAEAAALFRQAADLGDTAAMIDLGECYRSGDGVTQDESTALSWFRRAAEAGNTSAMVLTGAMYLLGGEGIEPDDATAAQWFQKASDRNSAAGMYDLGTMYEDGRGVPVNLEKAEQLYRKSADRGNTEARRRLASLQAQK